jgi:hypothetical protein
MDARFDPIQLELAVHVLVEVLRETAADLGPPAPSVCFALGRAAAGVPRPDDTVFALTRALDSASEFRLIDQRDSHRLKTARTPGAESAGGFSEGQMPLQTATDCDRQLAPSVLLTWLNVVLMLDASDPTTATMPMTMSPTSTAYSTAVGPSSLVKNPWILLQIVDILKPPRKSGLRTGPSQII